MYPGQTEVEVRPPKLCQPDDPRVALSAQAGFVASVDLCTSLFDVVLDLTILWSRLFSGYGHSFRIQSEGEIQWRGSPGHQTKQPVLVRTPQGFIQILPYELPEAVPPAARGELKLTRRELTLHNAFGESL